MITSRINRLNNLIINQELVDRSLGCVNVHRGELFIHVFNILLQIMARVLEMTVRPQNVPIFSMMFSFFSMIKRI